MFLLVERNAGKLIAANPRRIIEKIRCQYSNALGSIKGIALGFTRDRANLTAFPQDWLSANPMEHWDMGKTLTSFSLSLVFDNGRGETGPKRWRDAGW